MAHEYLGGRRLRGGMRLAVLRTYSLQVIRDGVPQLSLVPFPCVLVLLRCIYVFVVVPSRRLFVACFVLL